jgi:periplasmic divalent cation tolerance protein
MAKTCLYLITATPEESQVLARKLVESKLAARVQVSSPVASVYRWQGDIEVAQECQLWIKSTDEKRAGIINLLKESHSYEVPEFIQIPITYGLPEYLHWVLEETKNP